MLHTHGGGSLGCTSFLGKELIPGRGFNGTKASGSLWGVYVMFVECDGGGGGARTGGAGGGGARLNGRGGGGECGVRSAGVGHCSVARGEE